ncbi:MAG: hypothetical protein ABJD97_03745, partial [Betaproteobacteria bacterium]
MTVGTAHTAAGRRLVVTRSIARCAVLVASVLGGSAAIGAALVLLDDFAGTVINPARFEGDEGRQYGASRMESKRGVATGQLVLEAKAYSDQYSNTGVATSRNSVVLVKSTAVTDLRATFTMASATTLGCTANASPARAGGRLFGFFFNAGYPTPGSEYNDVFAGIQVFRLSNSADAAGVLRVTGYIGVCTDDSCIGSTTLSSVDLGTTTLNTPIALQVSWDKANHRFSYQRDAQTAVLLPYTVSDVMPPQYAAKRIEVSNQMPSCSAAHAYAYSRATVDNVMTNALPAAPALPLSVVASPVALDVDPL